MALAPFRRERAVKEILLVKALPLRVVLLYRTAGWNARLFRKSLCKRLCKSLKSRSSAEGRPSASGGAPPEAKKRLFPFPSAEGRPSADPAAQPVEANQALPGPGIFAMTWLCIAAARRRGCRCSPAGYAVPTARRDCRRPAAGTKGGKGTKWFPFPLLTPPNLPLRRDALRLRGETGVTGARFRASGSFWEAVMP